MENEALTLRRLCADDLFTMMRILSQIGVNDLRSVMPTKTAIQRVREGSESAESLGVTVALMLADKLLARLPDCKAEIYTAKRPPKSLRWTWVCSLRRYSP